MSRQMYLPKRAEKELKLLEAQLQDEEDLFLKEGQGRGKGAGEEGKVGGVLDIMHDLSRMTIDPRIPTMPGRSTSGFHRPGRCCLLHQSAKHREVFSESHEGWALSY